MQIVIDIDENLYTRLIDTDVKYIEDLHEACVAIRKGTPLPKGHGRLIDAEVFTHNVVKYSHQSTKTIGKALADTPTIIEADKEEA